MKSIRLLLTSCAMLAISVCIGQPVIPYTTYTYLFMTNQTAAQARAYLGMTGTGGTNYNFYSTTALGNVLPSTNVTVTDSAFNNVFTFAPAANKSAGALVVYTLSFLSGANTETLQGKINVSAHNNAGTVTANATKSGNDSASGAGTLSDTWDTLVAGTNVTLRVRPTSALAVAGKCYFTALFNGDGQWPAGTGSSLTNSMAYVDNVHGGTGQDSSAWEGLVVTRAGTWSAIPTNTYVLGAGYTMTGPLGTVGGTNTGGFTNTGDLYVGGSLLSYLTNNTRHGTSALGSAIAGANGNVAIGALASPLVSTGAYTTAIGFGAMGHAVNPYADTALGYLALHDFVGDWNNDGYNTALGTEALSAHLTGKQNVAVGYHAGHFNLAGSRNVFLGNQAGMYTTNSDTLIIDSSGYATLEDELNRTLLRGTFNQGMSAQSLRVNAGSFAVHSGYASGTELVSNGSFTSDTGSWSTYLSTIASVAGGVAGNCLEITAAGAAWGTAYQSLTTVAGRSYVLTFYQKNGTGPFGSRVFVGTALNVWELYPITSFADAAWTAHTCYFTATGTASVIHFVVDTGIMGETTLIDSVSVKEAGSVFVNNGDILATGSVGIGTNTPVRKLTVMDTAGPQLRLGYGNAGTYYTDLQTDASGYLYVNPSGGAVGFWNSAPHDQFVVKVGTDRNFGISDLGGATTIRAQNDAGSGNTPVAFWGSSFSFNQGDVGVGTNAPSSKLHITGTTDATQLTVDKQNAGVSADLVKVRNLGVDAATIGPTGTYTAGSTTTGANVIARATEGAELVLAFGAGNWTLGADWSTNTGALVKVAGTTTATCNDFTPTAGVTYKVVMVVNPAASSPTYTLGGVTGTTLTTTTITDYITASTTGKLIFAGVAAGTCTITSISVKALTDATGDVYAYGDLMVHDIKNLKGTSVFTINPAGEVGRGANPQAGYSLSLNNLYTASGINCQGIFYSGTYMQATAWLDASDSSYLFDPNSTTYHLTTKNGTGKSGFGTNAPTAKLEVQSGMASGLATAFQIITNDVPLLSVKNHPTSIASIGHGTPTSMLHIAGPIATSIATGGGVTLTETNSTYLLNVDGHTNTLPTPVGCNGREYIIKLVAPATTGYIVPAAGTMDGAAYYTLSASNKFVHVKSDNANWWIIGNN